MPEVLLIAGSPSNPSRSTAALEWIGSVLESKGYSIDCLLVRDLPPEPLVQGVPTHPAIVSAIKRVAQAKAVVVATPVYKASYSGTLKVFLDLLPQDALSEKSVLPIASGGSVSQLLALEYTLKPLLSALGARHILSGVFLPDDQIPYDSETGYQFERQATDRLRAAVGSLEWNLRKKRTPTITTTSSYGLTPALP